MIEFPNPLHLAKAVGRQILHGKVNYILKELSETQGRKATLAETTEFRTQSLNQGHHPLPTPECKIVPAVKPEAKITNCRKALAPPTVVVVVEKYSEENMCTEESKTERCGTLHPPLDISSRVAVWTKSPIYNHRKSAGLKFTIGYDTEFYSVIWCQSEGWSGQVGDQNQQRLTSRRKIKS